MKDEDIQKLLGGYATDTLTDRERELLYSAALHNQELFNALAGEQALREVLADPASRRQLLQALQPREPGLLERLTSWMRRPAPWAVAGGVMAALVVAVAIRQSRPSALDTGRNNAPAEIATGAKRAEKPVTPAAEPAPVRRAKATAQASRDDKAPAGREEERNAINAPAAARSAPFKDEAAASSLLKFKLAVFDFDSDARSETAKEADSARPDVGKTASDLLGKKLDSSGYTVIDRKQVDQVVQAQNLRQRQIDPSTAASLGRRLGADAVILGSVKQVQFAQNKGAPGAAGGYRAPTPQAQSRFAQQNEIQVTAQAINTQTAGNLAVASAQGEQTPGGGLAVAVDQVASSLGQQIQQNARIKIEGLVTNVNARVVTLNIGSKAGVKVGDRLEIKRDGKTIGRVAIGSVRDSLSAGFFEGADPPRIGDVVAPPQ